MNIENILQFILYIIIYSFFGWILESVLKTIYQKKFVNSGFLNGPICPIYGFGAIIMELCLSSLRDKPIILFITAFLLLSLWEYIVGYLIEKIFKTKYWDYSNLRFNIQGRVCLKNSIYWGLLGLIFVKWVHPFIESIVKLIPINTLFYIDIIIGVVILIDTIITIIQITNIDVAIQKLNDLSENIKSKVEELKGLKDKAKTKTEEFEKSNIENVEKLIKDLKATQAKLKIKIYKQANRLKKAFPTMKSETITQFLSQKIDLKNLKNNIKKKDKE